MLRTHAPIADLPQAAISEGEFRQGRRLVCDALPVMPAVLGTAIQVSAPSSKPQLTDAEWQRVLRCASCDRC